MIQLLLAMLLTLFAAAPAGDPIPGPYVPRSDVTAATTDLPVARAAGGCIRPHRPDRLPPRPDLARVDDVNATRAHPRPAGPCWPEHRCPCCRMECPPRPPRHHCDHLRDHPPWRASDADHDAIAGSRGGRLWAGGRVRAA